MRFPTPYSPAGSTTRGASSPVRGSPLAPAAGSSTGSPPRGTGGLGAGKGGSLGSKDSPGKRASGPLVSYDRGPTRRVELPRGGSSVTPSPVKEPTRGKGSSAAPRASDKPSEVSGGTIRNWRDLRRSDPKTAKEIAGAAQLAGRGHQIASGAAAGTIGGVYPSGYRGGLDLDGSGSGWSCNPWYSPGWNCNYYYWNSWCWWSSAWYWSWYYPCWWWYSRPYSYGYYAYYPATTVVYAEPQVIYLERETSYVNEPVGEAVVPQQGRVAAPEAAPESPLSIAAQRYLELGDRAFREGRYADAVQFYAKAVEFAPDQGALYLVLADALFAAGDYHYGAYAARRALELDPALVESNVDKHGFYPDPRHFDEQLARLELYLDDHPSDRDARLVLGLNYLFGARPKDAVRVLESASSAMAEDPAAQRILARARVASGG